MMPSKQEVHLNSPYRSRPPLALLSAGAALLFLPDVFAAGVGTADSLEMHFSVGAKVTRLFSSYTSYEFGNPLPPYQAPLSRLEFPLDSWWGGIELGTHLGRFSVRADASTNFSKELGAKMQDWDWDDTGALETYSESKCRLDTSYRINVDLDAETSDLLELPHWFTLRPLVGYRWQELNFVTHDGLQYDYDFDPPDVTPLPGDGIAFTQSYSQYFVGLRSGVELHDFSASVQADWAYVEGHNADHHLLRIGNRYTYEDTYGEARHASLRLKQSFSQTLSLTAEADYLQISTKGNHRLVYPLFDTDLTWSNGVRVWSQQASVSLTLASVF